MMRKEDDPRLPPKCPNCKRRYFFGYYGEIPTMDAGVCRPCSAARRELLAKDAKRDQASRRISYHPMRGKKRYRPYQPVLPYEREQTFFSKQGQVFRIKLIGFVE